MNAHLPPFRTISAKTQGHFLDRPISIETIRQLEKLSADLHVAAVALDAAMTRVQAERLPVELSGMLYVLTQCGAIRINIEDVLNQARRPDVASSAAQALYAKTKKLKRVA